jgi:hypothetical protein
LHSRYICFQRLHGHAGAAQVKQGCHAVWRAFGGAQRIIRHGDGSVQAGRDHASTAAKISANTPRPCTK